MPGLTTQQKNAVTQFVSFTQADKKTAERVSLQYFQEEQYWLVLLLAAILDKSWALRERSMDCLRKLFIAAQE